MTDIKKSLGTRLLNPKNPENLIMRNKFKNYGD